MNAQPGEEGAATDVPPERDAVKVGSSGTSVIPPGASDPVAVCSPDPGPTNDGHFSVSGATVSVDVNVPGSGVEVPKGKWHENLAAVQAAAPPGYEILRVLGRGGMGVVYEAQQLSLKRRVALKTVTAGVHSDPLQHARFQIEAESVAALQHPNIVQIYEVGEYTGVPYFSLELIGGGSLEGKIQNNPQPPRESAEMVRKLARAMHYAHQQGIVHRDLKPANVLLTQDGQPKISDFGLAKRVDSMESFQTQAGTILGTPSYMAPEQASGDIEGIGPASDVYALGAILYRLLAGRPPFQGATLVETLDAVRSKEPTPVRQLQPRVPRDLDIICLTCLQKSKARRYLSAETLARDLDHFLAGEPIEARPVGAAERLWRWCKRNPGIAALTATVFALLAAVAISSSVLAYRIDQEKNQTEQERQSALAAQALAQKNEGLAQQNADKAVEQGGLALRALGTLIDKVETQIGDTPGMQPLKATLLTTALEGLDKVANSDADSRLHGQSIAAAYMKMGNLFQQLGQSDKAYDQYLKCHAIIKSMAERDWEGGEVSRDNLASTFSVLADMSRELKHDLRAALDYYQQAFDIRKELLSRPLKRPDKLDPTKLKGRFAESSTRVGITYLLLGEPARASEFFDRARAIRQELVDAALAGASANPEAARSCRLDLARTYNALAEIHFRARDWTATRADYAQALALNEAVYREEPAKPMYRWELANTLGNQGLFEARTGQLAEAKKNCDRCFAIMGELAGLDPNNANYQRSFGKAHYDLGMVARRQHDAGAAQKYDQKCLQIHEHLAEANPKNERRRIELMLVLPRCGQHARAASDADKLLSGNPDREVLVEVAQCYAQCAGAVLADPALRAAYTDKALDALARAVDQGYKDVVILETEPDLDAVRDDPRFRALLDRIGH